MKKLIVVSGMGANNLRNIIGVDVSATITDKINLPPNIIGKYGRAWLTKELKQESRIAALDHWVVEAPWAHPVWHSYSFVLIHLRSIRGFPPPIIHKQDATHELWIYAIDPEVSREEIISKGYAKHMWLSPLNFAAQFIEISDELACTRIKASVTMVCDKKLNPDTDFRSDWIRLYGNNMLKEEYKEEYK